MAHIRMRQTKHGHITWANNEWAHEEKQKANTGKNKANQCCRFTFFLLLLLGLRVANLSIRLHHRLIESTMEAHCIFEGKGENIRSFVHSLLVCFVPGLAGFFRQMIMSNQDGAKKRMKEA